MGPAIDRSVVIDFFQLLHEREYPLAFSGVDPSTGEEWLTSGYVDTVTSTMALIEKSDESYMVILVAAFDFFWMNPAHAPQPLREIAGDRADFGMHFNTGQAFCYILAELPEPNQMPKPPYRPVAAAPGIEPAPHPISARWVLPLSNEVNSVALSAGGDLLVSGHGR